MADDYQGIKWCFDVNMARRLSETESCKLAFLRSNNENKAKFSEAELHYAIIVLKFLLIVPKGENTQKKI